VTVMARLRQPEAPEDSRPPIPASLIRYNPAEWTRQAERATGMHAGGDEETRQQALRGLGKLVWGRARRAWAEENGYAMRELFDAQRAAIAEDPRPESR
jgi:hypothetical protein